MSVRTQSTSHAIIDKYSSGEINLILQSFGCQTLDVSPRYHRLTTLLRSAIRIKSSWLARATSAIRESRAKIILTGVDSNPYFYFLKHYLPKNTFIVVQNGIRGNFSNQPNGDFVSQLTHIAKRTGAKPAVDYILTFGEAHSDYYRGLVDGTTLEIGSLFNNRYSLLQSEEISTRVNAISLISSFDGKDHADIFPEGMTKQLKVLGSVTLTPGQYYRSLSNLAYNLGLYCRENKILFQILGKREADNKWERQFYQLACCDLPFEFVPRHPDETSLGHALTTRLTISHGSTLGYELLSRGHRVAFVNRPPSDYLGASGFQFRYGYPDSLSDEGLFWTSDNSIVGVKNLIEKVNCNNSRNSPELEFHRKRLMRFDPGNSVFHRLIESLHS